MALAWNAGWVNSPRGFESPILRQMMQHHTPGTRERDRGFLHPGTVISGQ